MASNTSSLDDHDLPKAILQRIIKAALPEGAALQKDARTALTKACTVFINYLAATAHDKACYDGHKIVNAEDVLTSLDTLDLGDIVPQLRAELEAHQQLRKEKRKPDANATATATTTDLTDQQQAAQAATVLANGRTADDDDGDGDGEEEDEEEDEEDEEDEQELEDLDDNLDEEPSSNDHRTVNTHHQPIVVQLNSSDEEEDAGDPMDTVHELSD